MGKEEKLGLTVKKENNFSEWYTQLIQKADLADYTSVSGCIVFKPYAYEIWEKIKQIVDERLKKFGVKNAYFPLFIPESLLKKEVAHVAGFNPEVAWVTKAGNTELKERLAIRPTSETIMYESYSKWIRSWRDLPLKINQWNNVVRWEFKHAVPFLRTREFLWNEGHTVFATKKEAEKEVFEILDMYNDVLINYLALKGIKSKKTDKEKFAGAEFSLSIELFLPNGKAIQGLSSHFDGHNFAKAFDIKFLDKDGKKKYVYQNTWAIATRIIGILIAIHGDNKGLVLPPNIATNKVVIVPIVFKGDKGMVLKKARELSRKLQKYGVMLDDRDYYSPGWKYNEWELKGIPIRLEIGPKDLKKKQVVLVRRDNNKKTVVKFSSLDKKVKTTLNDIQKSLLKKSENFLKNNIKVVKNYSELKKAINDKRLAKANWCNSRKCEDKIKNETQAKIIGIDLKEKAKGKCIVCGKKAVNVVYIAKSY